MTEDHIEFLLDQALEATFPASDPLAIATSAERRRIDVHRAAHSELPGTPAMRN